MCAIGVKFQPAEGDEMSPTMIMFQTEEAEISRNSNIARGNVSPIFYAFTNPVVTGMVTRCYKEEIKHKPCQ